MIGTALSANAKKVMLLGSGELGKEVAIECQRLGIEVIAVDRYENAPAMHVAHRSFVIDMLNKAELQQLIEAEQPDLIVPEIEAIATELLVDLEKQGVNVVPNARTVNLTMNREGIRTLVHDQLNIETSQYQFVDDFASFENACKTIGLPVVVKPIMSSSGKGQSTIKTDNQIKQAWQTAQEGGRAGKGRVIVEGFVDFDYEITLLTVKAIDGIHFCAPIGHRQVDGDYRESWQPQNMSQVALDKAHDIAKKVITELGGNGLYGVELFIKGNDVIFSEVSPRPHDTGLVTLISQNQSEFALHVRAILDLPIGSVVQFAPAASCVILGDGISQNIQFSGVEEALKVEHSQLRLFAKPSINGSRRLGVTLTCASTVEAAVENAVTASDHIKVHYES